LQCEKGVLVFFTTASDLRETSYFLKWSRDQLISLGEVQRTANQKSFPVRKLPANSEGQNKKMGATNFCQPHEQGYWKRSFRFLDS
jgi:hypothetical protein